MVGDLGCNVCCFSEFVSAGARQQGEGAQGTVRQDGMDNASVQQVGGNRDASRSLLGSLCDDTKFNTQSLEQ